MTARRRQNIYLVEFVVWVGNKWEIEKTNYLRESMNRVGQCCREMKQSTTFVKRTVDLLEKDPAVGAGSKRQCRLKREHIDRAALQPQRAF